MWRETADRRPGFAVLLSLLAALVAAATLAPAAAGTIGLGFVEEAGPVALLAPAITGDPRVGGTLGCARGGWDDSDREPYDVTYEWFRNDEDHPAAATPTYKVTAEDVGQQLACVATAHDRWRTGFAFSNALTVSGPQSLTRPAVTGDDRIGGTLTCASGTWDDRGLPQPYALSYAWLRDDEPIADAKAYTVTQQDIGRALSCAVTAAGTTIVTSGAVHPDGPRIGTRPQLGGDPRVGGTLTCSPGTWDGTYALAYTFTRDGQPLAAGNSHVVGAADVGHALACEVTADGLTVAASGPVTINAHTPAEPAEGEPGWSTAPAVTGDVRVGRTVGCGDAAWDGDYALSTRWSVADRAVGTGARYTVRAADVGKQLRCDVTAEGEVTAIGKPRTVPAPRALVPPSISGTGTLTCFPGTWDGPYATAITWQRDGADFDTGETTTATEPGSYRCVVSVPGASAVSAPVSVGAAPAALTPVLIADPVNLLAPTIDGTPRLKGTLTCGPGAWDATYAYTYRWLHGDAQVGTGATITPTTPGELTCEVTAAGTTKATSTVNVTEPRNLTPPSLDAADPRIGAVLTCRPGRWDGDYAFTYAWTRDGAPAGTAAAYTVTADDVGTALACDVTAEGLVSLPVDSVSPHGPVSLTPPALTGAPVLHGTLKCSTGTWDADYTLSYRWLRNGSDIDGENGIAYTVGEGDVGATISCAVTAEDMAGAESAGAQIDSPHPLDGIRIEGDMYVGRTVTCGGAWNDREGARYQLSYQWWHDVERFAPIAGATSKTYTLTAGDAGSPLRCRVMAEGGFQEDSDTRHARWEDLELYVSADDDSVEPTQADNGYTVTVRNPNAVEKAVEQLELTLPTGFSFVPGSTTGDAKTQPTMPGGGRLRWTERLQMDPYGQTTFHIKVTGAAAPGHYYVGAWADPDGYDIGTSGDWDTARITVEAPATCTITGTPGDDVLTGTEGDDVICGLGGNDRLSGAGGNDTLLGGYGDDVLEGGPGADTLRGGGGFDTVNYSDRVTPVAVTVGDATTPDGTPETDTTPAEGDDVQADVEVVRGGRGDDFLSGGKGDQQLYGGAGKDKLNGGEGDDLLDGGAGDDWLEAPDSRSDRYQCGAGVDTFERDDLDRIAGCEREWINPVASR